MGELSSEFDQPTTSILPPDDFQVGKALARELVTYVIQARLDEGRGVGVQDNTRECAMYAARRIVEGSPDRQLGVQAECEMYRSPDFAEVLNTVRGLVEMAKFKHAAENPQP